MKVVNIWNSLPNNVVLCHTVNKFKSYLDKFWQHHILYNYKAEFTEPEIGLHITRTSYIGYQYFVSFALAPRP